MRRIALLATVVLAGCGSSGVGGARQATLVLDFTPNAIHAGIYAAIAQGYLLQREVALQVVAPTASTDAVRLLESGRARFAILDIHDLAIARERGAPIVGVMAVVQRPLAAVIAAPAVRTPRQLAGRAVGITGVPSDTAVLRSVVTGAGGDPRRVRTVTIGFNAVAALLAGRVAAATAFWNDEGITLARDRPGFHAFRVEHFGAPAYPELVLCVSRATLSGSRPLVSDVVSALEQGYRFTLAHPTEAAAELEAQVPGLDAALVAAQLHALLPVFAGPGGQVGGLDPARLRAWARWERRFGIVTRPPDVGRMFSSVS